MCTLQQCVPVSFTPSFRNGNTIQYGIKLRYFWVGRSSRIGYATAASDVRCNLGVASLPPPRYAGEEGMSQQERKPERFTVTRNGLAPSFVGGALVGEENALKERRKGEVGRLASSKKGGRSKLGLITPPVSPPYPSLVARSTTCARDSYCTGILSMCPCFLNVLSFSCCDWGTMRTLE